MTVSTELVRSGPYYPNGVTVNFPFSVRAITASDIEVVRLNADGSTTPIASALYSVTINSGGQGGTVIFTSPLATSALPHYVQLTPSFLQGISFENQGAYLPTVLTEALDRADQRDLWLRDQAQRALRAPIGETLAPISSLATRAGKFLAFDGAGNPIAATGGGGDSGLRTDLGVSTGAALVGTATGNLAAVLSGLLASASNTIALAAGSKVFTAFHSANKRSEISAAGWLGMTTATTATYSYTQNEGPYPSVRNAARSVTLGTAVSAPIPVTFTAPHNMKVNDWLTIAGCATTAYNADKQVTAVTDDFTVMISYGGASLAAPGGTPTAAIWGIFVPLISPSIRLSLPRSAMNATFNGDWMRFPAPVVAGPDAKSVNSPYLAYSAEFTLNDDTLEVIRPSSGNVDIWVDGCKLQFAPYDFGGGAGYPMNLQKFVFSHARPKNIRVRTWNGGMVGLGVKSVLSITPAATQRRLRMALLGDSFGEPDYYGYGALLAARMGWDFVNVSSGGTGITTNGGQTGRYKFIDRVEQNLGVTQPDIVLVQNSINTTQTMTQADCEALFDAIRIVAPNARIIGCGRVYPTYNPPAINLSEDVLFKAACATRAVQYLDGGIAANGLPAWLSSANNATYYNGTTAAGTTTVASGAVTAATVSAVGVGYDFFRLPLVTLSGGGGTGAAVTANWNGEVTATQVLDGGFGYTVAPTVVIECGGAAVARLSGGAVNNIVVTDVGGGYLAAPIVTFTGGGGTGAAATATIEDGRLVRITITAAGSGYSTAPTVVISESTTKATATATISGGKVTGLTLTGAGSFYKSIPRVRFISDASGGQGAVAVAHVSSKLDSLAVTAGGSGYSTQPAITIAHPTGGDVTHPKVIGYMMIAERYAYQLDVQP